MHAVKKVVSVYLHRLTALNYRFKRTSRLLSQYEYTQVFKQAKRVSGVYWQVLARDTKQPLPRLGLAISKRVLKQAVDRNIYKRIAREIFRLNQYQLPQLDFVVMAKKKYQNQTQRKQLHLELLSLFNRCIDE